MITSDNLASFAGKSREVLKLHRLSNCRGLPNSELILGYGFALPHNPDDTIVLKLGGQNDGPGSGKWEVGRNARGVEPLWEALKGIIRGSPAPHGEDPSYDIETEFATIDLLSEMTANLRDRLPLDTTALSESARASARPEVLQMLDWYLEGTPTATASVDRPAQRRQFTGQRDILDAIIEFTRTKEGEAMEFAQEHGISIGEDDES